MNLRCFVAIDVPVEIKDALEELARALKSRDGDVKWVDIGNMHLTLKFLGHTPEDLLLRIKKSLVAVSSCRSPFYIKIYGTGIFPTEKNPRVIWVGIEDSEILRNLRDGIENAMSLLGYQREDRVFRPHLTLGRVRSRRGMIGTLKELERYKETEFGTIHVIGLRLMKSDLKPKGAEYTCIYDLPLGVSA